MPPSPQRIRGRNIKPIYKALCLLGVPPMHRRPQDKVLPQHSNCLATGSSAYYPVRVQDLLHTRFVLFVFTGSYPYIQDLLHTITRTLYTGSYLYLCKPQHFIPTVDRILLHTTGSIHTTKPLRISSSMGLCFRSWTLLSP